MNDDDRDWSTTKALLQHFEDEWTSGKNPDPDEYLARVPERDKAAFLAAIDQLRDEGIPRAIENSNVDDWEFRLSIRAIVMLIVATFCALLVLAPNVWAAVMAAGFILISGQIFTRIVLNMPAGRKQWCWSIATGFGLLGF